MRLFFHLNAAAFRYLSGSRGVSFFRPGAEGDQPMHARCAPTAVSGTVFARPSSLPVIHKSRPKVVTIVEDELRGTLDLATNSYFASIHVATVLDAIEAARDTSVRALLISPAFCKERYFPMLTRLVARCPGVAAVAVVAEGNGESPEKFLDLGACGIKQVVDLATSEGWSKLRALVNQAGGEAGASIMCIVDHALVDACPQTQRFFQLLVRHAPTTPTVTRLAAELRVLPSTFNSRFVRSRLPSARQYLSAVRLLYVVALLETPGSSISEVVVRLGYSSPQSFGRHVYGLLGVTGGELRREYQFPRLANKYISEFIAPYRRVFESFDPFGGCSIGSRAKVDRGPDRA